MVMDALIQKNKSSVASVTLFLFGGRVCGGGERPQGKPPQAASARSAGFGGAEAPCGRIGAALWVAEGQREVPHTGKVK